MSDLVLVVFLLMICKTDADALLQALSPMTDQQWLEVLVNSVQKPVISDIELPGFPPDSFQLGSVGSAGEQTLREAFTFYREIKSYAENLGIALTRDSRILDFGCGWGRIIRFFLKDVSADNLYGVDVYSQMIDYCRKLVRYGNYTTCNSLPPTEFPDASMDIIYAYSVFSHLAEPVHINWVAEFVRILKPGGILVVTTQPRRFIEFCRSLRGKTHEYQWFNCLANSFVDVEASFSDYDSGKFLFSATGGGPELHSSFYGETLIPKGYVEREWTKYLIFRDFVDDQNRLPQALIVMQKPDRYTKTDAERLEAVMTVKNARIYTLGNLLNQIGTDEDGSEAVIKAKDDHIRNLETLVKERESTLNNIYRSRGWKVLTIYYKVRDKILRRCR